MQLFGGRVPIALDVLESAVLGCMWQLTGLVVTENVTWLEHTSSHDAGLQPDNLRHIVGTKNVHIHGVEASSDFDVTRVGFTEVNSDLGVVVNVSRSNIGMLRVTVDFQVEGI
jgi:hypothetical protein